MYTLKLNKKWVIKRVSISSGQGKVLNVTVRASGFTPSPIYAYSVKGKVPSHCGITFVSWAFSPCPGLRERRRKEEVQRGASRDKPESTAVSTWERVYACVCVFLYPGYLSPQQPLNGAFISGSIVQTNVLKNTP